MRLICFCFFVLVSLASVAYTATVTPASSSPANVAVFDRYEISLTVDQVYDNPYDPDEIRIDAIICLPSGKRHVMPCFWMVPMRNGNRMTEQAGWRLRYAPIEQGQHEVYLKLTDKSGTVESAKFSFVATPARDSRGFLQQDSGNPQFLRFMNGAPYFPIGCYVPAENAAASFNWSRYWLSAFNGRGLEWSRESSRRDWADYEGLGRYSQRAADLLDRELQLCEQRGLYMQLVMNYHEQVLEGTQKPEQKFTGNAQWGDPGSPFWSGNGGPVSKAEDWFADPQVRRYSQKQFRYIIARWGYSTHILGWELFNETDFSDAARVGRLKDIAGWHQDMAAYAYDNDPYRHMVLTSISDPHWAEVGKALEHVPHLDMVQYHFYSDALRDLKIPQDERFKRMRKASWMCEFGIDPPEKDPTGLHLRRTTWQGAMNAVPAMFFVTHYAMQSRFAPMFAALRDFMADTDIVRGTGGISQCLGVISHRLSTAPIVIRPVLIHWGAEPESVIFLVRADGTLEHGEQMPQFLYGSDHDGKNTTIRLATRFAAPAKIHVELKGGDDKTPAIVELISGANASQKIELTGKPGTLVLSLPAGQQNFALRNIGKTQAELVRITINTMREPLAGVGYVGPKFAMGYVYDNTAEDTVADSARTFSQAQILLSGIMPGRYQAILVDPQSGQKSILKNLVADELGLLMRLPEFTQDVGFKIAPAD